MSTSIDNVPVEMEVETIQSTEVMEEAAKHDSNVIEEEEEEDVEDLLDLIDQAKDDPSNAIEILLKVMDSPKDGPKATQIKERAVYDLTRAYCRQHQYSDIVLFLETSTFFRKVTKAKCAKVVRQILDIVCSLAPDAYGMQKEICKKIIEWCRREKRTFLRQRVEAKLAAILFQQSEFGEALQLIDRLLHELKKIDDKQLLVETHLMESKIYFGLRNVPKAKAALTASRTAANAIYVAPNLQAAIDTMSGTIHTEESDYNTAHSYFLEAFEQLDQLNEETQAVKCLKYMMLCRILDSLTKTLKMSAKGAIGVDKSGSSSLDVSNLVTSRQAVKYAGRDLEAMTAIAKAASERSLNDYEKVLTDFSSELQQDLLIKHHLHILQEQLLESNLIRIMEPYSCVELHHIATLMDLPLAVVEKKLSQMILDGKFQGILDQGKGQLIIYEDAEKDKAMEKGLQVLEHMDQVVSTLFAKKGVF
ncbi:PCI domain containing protein [Nitzschia inconspicua]|uniref:PCI domain containing protein n=1 Tax=Nitzschia inconspicua TaxID=303405 RepID=A0A9K3PX77_9STRA|nr:PCI domain containing protein [Nitzschia inconspicua]